MGADIPPDRPTVVDGVPALLSVSSVARVLDCSGQTIRRRIAEGDLPAVRDRGRLLVRADDLRGFIDAMEYVGPRPSQLPRRRSAGRRTLAAGRADRRFPWLSGVDKVVPY